MGKNYMVEDLALRRCKAYDDSLGGMYPDRKMGKTKRLYQVYTVFARMEESSVKGIVNERGPGGQLVPQEEKPSSF